MSPKSVRRARSARPSAVPRYASAPACCVTVRISSSAACSTPTPDIRKSREDLLATIRARLNESETEAKKAADELFGDERKA